MSVPAKTHRPEGVQSREATFSHALWKLDRDLKEQVASQPKGRAGRKCLLILIIALLYGLSSGPAEVLVNLIGPTRTSIEVYRFFYYPVVVLHEQTPLHPLLEAYFKFWDWKVGSLRGLRQ